MNQINQILVYRTKVGFAFDDHRVGLKGEAFVMGIPKILDHYIKGASSFVATFSKDEFPGERFVLELIREESRGGWYRDRETGMEGWLCPATLLYFEELPKEIHVQLD